MRKICIQMLVNIFGSSFEWMYDSFFIWTNSLTSFFFSWFLVTLQYNLHEKTINGPGKIDISQWWVLYTLLVIVTMCS